MLFFSVLLSRLISGPKIDQGSNKCKCFERKKKKKKVIFLKSRWSLKSIKIIITKRSIQEKVDEHVRRLSPPKCARRFNKLRIGETSARLIPLHTLHAAYKELTAAQRY